MLGDGGHIEQVVYLYKVATVAGLMVCFHQESQNKVSTRSSLQIELEHFKCFFQLFWGHYLRVQEIIRVLLYICSETPENGNH